MPPKITRFDGLWISKVHPEEIKALLRRGSIGDAYDRSIDSVLLPHMFPEFIAPEMLRNKKVTVEGGAYGKIIDTSQSPSNVLYTFRHCADEKGANNQGRCPYDTNAVRMNAAQFKHHVTDQEFGKGMRHSEMQVTVYRGNRLYVPRHIRDDLVRFVLNDKEAETEDVGINYEEIYVRAKDPRPNNINEAHEVCRLIYDGVMTLAPEISAMDLITGAETHLRSSAAHTDSLMKALEGIPNGSLRTSCSIEDITRSANLKGIIEKVDMTEEIGRSLALVRRLIAEKIEDVFTPHRKQIEAYLKKPFYEPN